MQIHALRTTILSPMSKILTMVLISIIALCSAAQTQYPIWVIKEARVSVNSESSPAPAYNCKNETLIVKPEYDIKGFNDPHNPPAIKISQISTDQALYATQYTNMGHLNDAAIWLGVRVGKKRTYYKLSDIHLKEYIIPTTIFKNGLVTIEAVTLTEDPDDQDNPYRIPTIEGRHYQMVRLGQITAEGLSISSMTCTR